MSHSAQGKVEGKAVGIPRYAAQALLLIPRDALQKEEMVAAKIR